MGALFGLTARSRQIRARHVLFALAAAGWLVAGRHGEGGRAAAQRPGADGAQSGPSVPLDRADPADPAALDADDPSKSGGDPQGVADPEPGSRPELGSGPQVGPLAVAAAMEQVLVETIAATEGSVVAIARVRRGRPAVPLGGLVPPEGDPFGRLLQRVSPPAPTDPDFIPHEYGTGVVVDKRGLILTQYHVLGEEDDHWVSTADRKVLRARIKAADPRSGLAMLAIDTDSLRPIRLGDAAQVRKGQIVIALGNPFAIARDGQVSASWGIVSNIARKAGPIPSLEPTDRRATLHHFGTLIQTDARLNLGTSGGALINLRGEMIGLTTSLAATAGYETAAGYAVPIDEAFRRVVDLLKEGKEVDYGLLGVRPENLPAEEVLAGKRGMRVGSVIDGTPAQRAGLQSLDEITHVNGRPVYDADGLVLEVGRLAAAARVRLTVRRRDRLREVDVRLAKYPVQGRKIVSSAPSPWRGLQVDYSTVASEYEMRARMGQVDLEGCVTVTAVAEESPAWKVGLRPYAFISHVGRRRVRTPEEFRAAVAGRGGPVALRLTLPDDQQPVRTVPPEE